jgi:hypothetical protein
MNNEHQGYHEGLVSPGDKRRLDSEAQFKELDRSSLQTLLVMPWRRRERAYNMMRFPDVGSGLLKVRSQCDLL